jgi:competence protein ComEC
MQTRSDDFYARPIIALLLALITGIVLGCQFPGFAIGALSIGLLTAVYMGTLVIRKKAAGPIPIIFFVILGYAAVQPWLSPRFSAEHIQQFSDETRWQISGVVDSHPFEIKYLKKFILRADTLTYKKVAYRVTGKIRVTVRGQSPTFGRGDRVVFHSRLRQIRNFNNPGGFNYQRYMAFKGIWRTAFTKGDRLQVVQKKSSSNLAQQLNDSRLAMSALIERAGKGPSRAVLKALVIGDRAAISSELRDTFNRAGVGHILAISGLHIGIVATVAFLLFQNLLCFVKPFLWRAWTRKGAAIFALFPVCIYGLISGMSPSTQRAVIMVAVFLMTFLATREADTINTLALAAFFILIVYPPSLFSISFQLSFLAVLSILYGLLHTQPILRTNDENFQAGFRFWLTRKILAFFLVSFFAICGTLPLVMFYFNQISVIGLLANFIVVPVVGFVVIPCGLLALFCYPISSQIAYGCLKICIYVLDHLLVVIKFFANLPFAAFKTITPSIFEIVCYYILGWVLLNVITAKLNPASADGVLKCPKDPASPPARRTTATKSRTFLKLAIPTRNMIARLRIKRSAILWILLILVFAGDAGYWLYQRFGRQDLRVTYIDVGQGNAAFLELPGGYTALIDGGGFSDNNVFDMGARVIAPFLWRKKIQTIDALVLTHPNSDHLNGLLFIAQHFNIKTIWTNGESKTTRGYKHFKKIIFQKQLDLLDFKHMPRKQRINGVEFFFMYPPGDFLDKKAVQKWRNTNNNSLVLKVTFGDISFLFPGDIMAEAEKELVALSGADLACNVLLAPHHGSRSSNSRLFLSIVQPDVAVISAGWKNRFGFPHSTVLEAYKKSGCRIMRTDRDGAITFTTDGKRLNASSFFQRVIHLKAFPAQ